MARMNSRARDFRPIARAEAITVHEDLSRTRTVYTLRSDGKVVAQYGNPDAESAYWRKLSAPRIVGTDFDLDRFRDLIARRFGVTIREWWVEELS